jgi:hypothetical protein
MRTIASQIKAEPTTNQAANSTNRETADWGRTMMAKERINPIASQSVNMFGNRFIIERDSRIENGVYIGGASREAIVVDWKKPKLNELYDNIFKALGSDKRYHKTLLLASVFETVKKAFPNLSVSETDQLLQRYEVKPNRKVYIDVFIANGTGVCGHVALCCAALIERLTDEGHLSGKVSVDRNSISSKGAHAWCRYTNGAGEVIILDVMQNYLGKLSSSAAKASWDYFRPEDRATTNS